MTKKIIRLSAILSFLFINNLKAQQNLPVKAVEIKFGIFIKKIVPDFKENKFYTEFYWWAKYPSNTGLSDSAIMDLQYVNGYNVENGSFFKEREIDPYPIKNEETYCVGFHQGDFYFNPDFSYYPFDEQRMDILIEHRMETTEKMKLIIDTADYIFSKQKSTLWGISNDILQNKTASYKIYKSEIKVEDGLYNTNFGDPAFSPTSNYSRLNTSILLNRAFTPYIAKLIIPIFIILLLVYFVFFLPAEKVDIASGLTVTSLLSAIAFQLSVNSDMPDIGYIIYIDKVFYTCYALIALSMAQSLWTFYLDRTEEPKKIKLAKRIDIISRFLFPLVFFGSLILFAL